MEPLLALQEIDGRIRALQQEIQDLPDRKEQEKSRLKGALGVLAAAQSNLKITQLNLNAAEGEVANRKERMEKLRQQQQALKTNRDFQAMTHEITRATDEIEQCEARQIALMDEVTPAAARVAEAQAKLSADTEIVNRYLKELDRRMADGQAELTQCLTERTGALKAVTSQQALLAYTRLLPKRWPVIVPLEGGTVCGCCHLTQPPQMAHLVRRNAGIVSCQTCGRILYSAD
jgi:predicted  nucleic acid-binding Zn-ribbon protein